ncbi:hypothetical protein [Austwickia chelonae]|uniref:hypothetical protein n=1 Tax=Austwickia chelonae TaxID=100225 RepID=UPI0013C2ECAC|nr:hypothetical protein [Austwickia chelonae]
MIALGAEFERGQGHPFLVAFLYLFGIGLLLPSLGMWDGYGTLILMPDKIIYREKFSRTIIPWDGILIVKYPMLGGALFMKDGFRPERQFPILLGVHIPFREGEGEMVSLAINIFHDDKCYAANVVDFYLKNEAARQRLGTRESLRDIAEEVQRRSATPGIIEY